jgi:F0F1-type ATP synthase alpha subunit
VLPFETALHEYMKDQKKALLDEIRTAGKLTPEIESALSAAVAEAKKVFLAARPEAKVA